MKIAFLLPNYSGCVVGSLLVYYRYAAALAREGHEVDLIHRMEAPPDASLLARARLGLSILVKNHRRHPVPWMDFAAGIRPRFVERLAGLHLSHDLVVAFSWRCLEALESITTSARRYGYVVEYETWCEADPQTRARMESAYRLGIPLLASSKAVLSMLREVGAKDARLCVHGVETPSGAESLREVPRDPRRVGFPVRTEPVKAPEVLREALRLLKQRHGSDIVLWGFGSRNVPDPLRGLFDEFHEQPTFEELADLYRSSAVFAVPSRKEGFGMPAAEAMSRGCAVVSTDNGGVNTFGIDSENCLLVPVDAPRSLADAVSRLLEDGDLRVRISQRAPESVAFLSWPEAEKRFLEALGLDIPR